jgi:hypothetical protein
MIPPTPKGHLTNRRAFAEIDSREPFVKLYSKLVALELTLKDHDPANFLKQHDVCDMATTTFSGSSGVAAAAATLSGDLATLWCSDRYGQPSQVRSSKYPDLRYVRTASDFPHPSSTQAEITVALGALDVLVEELRKEGLPWP